MAEYAHPGQEAYRLLKNDDIQAAIQERLNELRMSADEVLVRLAEQARAAYSRYIEIKDNGSAYVDLGAMQADDKLHLIKAIRETKEGQQIEFYDAQTALVKLGDHHRVFKAGPSGTSDDPIHIVTIEAVEPPAPDHDADD